MIEGPRDLACVELWEESLSRSRRRREARDRQLNFGLVESKRIAVPAALLAGGAAVTGVVAGRGASSGGGDATAAATTTAAKSGRQQPDRSAAERTAAKRSAAKRTAPKRTAAKRTAAKRTEPKAKPKPKKPVVVQTLAQAQQLGGVKKGMRGAGVVRLQRELGVTGDGIYGPATLKAVRRVQKRSSLATDGIVGPATWGALSAPPSSSTTRPAVQRASKSKKRRASTATVRTAQLKRGSEVEALQAKLGLAVDGDYGVKTEQAVKRFQRRHGLKADGVVGPATWRALGLSSGNRTLHPHRFAKKRRWSTRHTRSRGGSGGSGSSVVARAIAAANRIATKPYRYGGGHGSFNDTGYDCSGSVSYVLHGAGLLDASLASGGFMSYGKPGPGKHITIYANPGHVFMTINGRRFDTGYGGNGNRWASGSRPTSGYTLRHPPGL